MVIKGCILNVTWSKGNQHQWPTFAFHLCSYQRAACWSAYFGSKGLFACYCACLLKTPSSILSSWPHMSTATCRHDSPAADITSWQPPAVTVVQIKTKGEKKKDKFFTMDPTQISFDMVRQKLKDIVMTRGKRGVDRNEQVEMLTYLATVAKGPVQKIEVLIQVVSALFDINPSMSTHMSVPLWKRCAGTVLEVLQTLADNQHIEVDEMYDNPEERTEEPPAGQPAKVYFILPFVLPFTLLIILPFTLLIVLPFTQPFCTAFHATHAHCNAPGSAMQSLPLVTFLACVL